MIDLATKIRPDIRVFYINTGCQFKETDETKRLIKERYNLNLIEYGPDLGIEEQTRKYGEELFKKDPDLCCHIRKVEPIKRALKDLDAWITGLRREQSPTRRNLAIVEVNERDGKTLVKVNPLASWTRGQVWKHILRRGIPYNPLYDRGYTSIGCEPCTLPVRPGEDERAGRWAGTGKKECGIHTFMEEFPAKS